ncbi:hypothetical protein Hypma_013555 [Hypsizygus marmoreus]|uniref:Uncharacterized protein n=1 Tax=Hypsizygus marmoreus TaxID=39966 RepID=A0A369JD18_HYPMA|nr:hypothetical protein Hypma_013555 [Hypsizygus marmoreus]
MRGCFQNLLPLTRPSQNGTVVQTESTLIDAQLDRATELVEGRGDRGFSIPTAANITTQFLRALSFGDAVKDVNIELTGVNLLPLEILGDIFLQALRSADSSERDSCSAPMNLSQVCRHWRWVALSMPTLWSSLSFSFHPRRLKTWKKLVHLWIERSGEAPLSLFLSHHHHVITQILAPCLPRLSYMSVYLSLDTIYEFLSTPFTNAISLTAVDIVHHDSVRETLDRTSKFVSSLPALRRLTWHSASSPTAFLGLSLPSLTQLTLHAPVPFDLSCAFLSKCSSAVHIELHRIQGPSQLMAPVKRTILPSLEFLLIHALGDINLLAFLDRFTFPSLQTLSIRPRSALSNHQSIDNLVERSSCEIKTLCLLGPLLEAHSVINYITRLSLQSLTELHITASRILDPVIKTLTCHNSSLDVLPNLIKLVLGWCATTDGVISEMVASRWGQSSAAAACLVSVNIEFWPFELLGSYYEPGHDQDVLAFESFREHGMAISWRSSLSM